METGAALTAFSKSVATGIRTHSKNAMMEMMKLKMAAIICVYLNVEMGKEMELRTVMMGTNKMEMDAQKIARQSAGMDKLMGRKNVMMGM